MTLNYLYDNLGRIVEDKAKNLVQTYNKENKIITQTIGSKVITYKYDFQSKRVSKTCLNHDSYDSPDCPDFSKILIINDSAAF